MKSARLSRSVKAALVWAFVCGAPTAEAQRPLRLQVQGMALTGTGFVGAGAGIGRSVTSRLDFSGSVSLGIERNRTRLRLEGVIAFHIVPATAEGWGIYGGAGIALHVAGDRARQYLMLLVGVEPNSRRGPFFEVGVGGGARFGAGFRVDSRFW